MATNNEAPKAPKLDVILRALRPQYACIATESLTLCLMKCSGSIACNFDFLVNCVFRLLLHAPAVPQAVRSQVGEDGGGAPPPSWSAGVGSALALRVS